MKLLVQWGADADAKNEAGAVPAEVCRSYIPCVMHCTPYYVKGMRVVRSIVGPPLTGFFQVNVPHPIGTTSRAAESRRYSE